MKILLTNDDGINSPGLQALYDQLQRLGQVQLVAPAVEQSGVGLSITYLHPLQVREERRHDEHYGWPYTVAPLIASKWESWNIVKSDLIWS